MTTERVDRWRWAGLVAIAAVALATACGGPGSGGRAADAAAATGARPDSTPAYGVLLGVLRGLKVPTCEPAEGGAYVPLSAPAPEAARAHSWYRYVEGRIYEFGPCQLAAGKRNELRVFLYPNTGARDLALREISLRGTRPTSTFAYGEAVAVEIWSPEPSLESPAGQLAQAVHSAIGALPQAWHLDLVPTPLAAAGA